MAQDTDLIKVGGGTLYVADYGEILPTDPATEPSGNWDALGYTAEGAVLGRELTTQQAFVDEFLDPVIEIESEVRSTLSMTIAQFTFDVLLRALNGGTVEVVGDIETFTPPAAGESAAFAALYRYRNEYDLWAHIEMPKVKNVANLSAPFRQRGADYRTVAIELRMFPDGENPAWRILSTVGGSS